jgi:hypothetical protein
VTPEPLSADPPATRTEVFIADDGEPGIAVHVVTQADWDALAARAQEAEAAAEACRIDCERLDEAHVAYVEETEARLAEAEELLRDARSEIALWTDPYPLLDAIDAFLGARDPEPPVRASERMNLNPDPLKMVVVKRCRGCGKRAPWCSCGAADYWGPEHVEGSSDDA